MGVFFFAFLFFSLDRVCRPSGVVRRKGVEVRRGSRRGIQREKHGSLASRSSALVLRNTHTGYCSAYVRDRSLLLLTLDSSQLRHLCPTAACFADGAGAHALLSLSCAVHHIINSMFTLTRDAPQGGYLWKRSSNVRKDWQRRYFFIQVRDGEAGLFFFFSVLPFSFFFSGGAFSAPFSRNFPNQPSRFLYVTPSRPC